MKVLRRRRTTRAGRVLRGLRLDRNPLRRGTDRAETMIILVLLAAFGCAAWSGAHAAASWSTASDAREMRAQHAAYRQVRAVLLEQPVPQTAFGTSLGP